MILVTGASGFVGQHLIAALRAELPNMPVRTFDVRRPAPPQGVEALEGDIRDRERMRVAVRGVEMVVHLAALVQPDARRIDEMRRINVDGTRTAYTAANAAGCTLFVHFSSAGVYGPPRDSRPFREDDMPLPVTPYQRTKWEAEQALGAMASDGIRLIVLRPAGIYGPGSLLELPEYRKVRRQRWVVDVQGGIVVHPTYVDDIVQAILAIVKKPTAHRSVFNIGGERPIQFQQLQALLAQAMGVSRHSLLLPTRLAPVLSVLGEPLLALRGRPNPLLGRMCRGDLVSSAVDDSRFRSLYPSVPVTELEQGLRETIRWATAERLL